MEICQKNDGFDGNSVSNLIEEREKKNGFWTNGGIEFAKKKDGFWTNGGIEFAKKMMGLIVTMY